MDSNCPICDSPMSSEAIENEWTTCSQACDRLEAMMQSIEGLTDAYFRGFVKQDHNATD